MTGFSAYLCIGKYGGFKIKWDAGLRITLGWISFAFVIFDLEQAMQIMLERNHELETAVDTISVRTKSITCKPGFENGENSNIQTT